MPTSRPLSPHLQIYRWTYTMAVSILHRVSGLILATGALLAALWLISLMRGPDSYEALLHGLRSLPGLLFVALLILSFWYHLSAGIRHLVGDTGRGLERREARRSAALVLLATALGSAFTLAVVAHRLWGNS
jgi:succinate dehydrogenase / fumarate reductase, cytochrome b subunit